MTTTSRHYQTATELHRCPCCGGEPTMIELTCEGEIIPTTYYVACRNPHCGIRQGIEWSNPERAAEKWNSRIS